MLSTTQFQARFSGALPYDQYVLQAKPTEQPGWEKFFARVALSPVQKQLIRGFNRRINVLVISGSWCGDCVQQCPILRHVELAYPAPHENPDAPGIEVRFVERNANLDWITPFRICAGDRVPVAIFLNEDFDYISMLGDRTLARYRAVAARTLGPSCPLPGAAVPQDELDATVTDWLNEFERVALLLRLSAKLRAKHAD